MQEQIKHRELHSRIQRIFQSAGCLRLLSQKKLLLRKSGHVKSPAQIQVQKVAPVAPDNSKQFKLHAVDVVGRSEQAVALFNTQKQEHSTTRVSCPEAA